MFIALSDKHIALRNNWYRNNEFKLIFDYCYYCEYCILCTRYWLITNSPFPNRITCFLSLANAQPNAFELRISAEPIL